MILRLRLGHHDGHNKSACTLLSARDTLLTLCSMHVQFSEMRRHIIWYKMAVQKVSGLVLFIRYEMTLRDAPSLERVLACLGLFARSTFSRSPAMQDKSRECLSRRRSQNYRENGTTTVH